MARSKATKQSKKFRADSPEVIVLLILLLAIAAYDLGLLALTSVAIIFGIGMCYAAAKILIATQRTSDAEC